MSYYVYPEESQAKARAKRKYDDAFWVTQQQQMRANQNRVRRRNNRAWELKAEYEKRYREAKQYGAAWTAEQKQQAQAEFQRQIRNLPVPDYTVRDVDRINRARAIENARALDYATGATFYFDDM